MDNCSYQIIAENFPLYSRKVMDGLVLEIANRPELVISQTFNEIVLEIKAFLVSHKEEISNTPIEFPSGWFQHLKNQLFPTWAKRIWPIKYEIYKPTSIIYYNICPHIRSDTLNTHVKFLITEPNIIKFGGS